MKKIITLFSIPFFLLGCETKQILEEPEVDNRVELLSIVFRLAESREYNSEIFGLYTEKIKKHFEPYKNHELIGFVKELREINSIGFDAVMFMAVYLDKNLNPRIVFSDNIPDKRWGKENADKFVKLLNEFYTDANCKEFFDENKSLYSEAESRFLPVYEQIDLNWFSSFFGNAPNEKLKILTGLGNGRQSYGPHVQLANNEREVYSIMGAWQTDSIGMVIFPEKEYFPTLIHEFSHSFVNHLVDDNISALEESGKKLFAVVQEKMRNQNYGHWTTMMYETLVRVSVIKYMKDHNYSPMDVKKEINRQLSLGFLWIEDVLTEIEEYDKKRKEYPTLESYMPTIIDAFQTYPQNIDIYREKIDKKRPQVVSISEFSNKDRNVSSLLKNVTINFDKPLSVEGITTDRGKQNEPYPNINGHNFSEDKKSIIIEWELEKNKEYVFVLTGIAIKSEEGVPINDYEISFETE
jgi:Domain of unknown function (DUF4932)